LRREKTGDSAYTNPLMIYTPNGKIISDGTAITADHEIKDQFFIYHPLKISKLINYTSGCCVCLITRWYTIDEQLFTCD
jgi:hypothetical protein